MWSKTYKKVKKHVSISNGSKIMTIWKSEHNAIFRIFLIETMLFAIFTFLSITVEPFEIETWFFYLYIGFRPQGLRWRSQKYHQINILTPRGSWVNFVIFPHWNTYKFLMPGSKLNFDCYSKISSYILVWGPKAMIWTPTFLNF